MWHIVLLGITVENECACKRVLVICPSPLSHLPAGLCPSPCVPQTGAGRLGLRYGGCRRGWSSHLLRPHPGWPVAPDYTAHHVGGPLCDVNQVTTRRGKSYAPSLHKFFFTRIFFTSQNDVCVSLSAYSFSCVESGTV